MKFHSRVASLNSVCFDNVRSPVGHHHHCPCKQSFKFSFEKMGNSRSLYHLFSFLSSNFYTIKIVVISWIQSLMVR